MFQLLLPLKQQVSAAEADNSEACKGATGGPDYQHATTLNASMIRVSCVFVLSYITYCIFLNTQLPAMMPLSVFPLMYFLSFPLIWGNRIHGYNIHSTPEVGNFDGLQFPDSPASIWS